MRDWRRDFLPHISDQAGNLKELIFEYRRINNLQRGDHVHCELCWVKISSIDNPQYQTDGYHCEKTGCWICGKCFSDFKKEYDWHELREE